ncbi:DegT/DnrJ/EryC1/StrS family aminotransferase [Algisphaera agarilytica]|uniref:Perosamine synthetase n=1 Tax=Algisphaera agarilytica TaxID=1385975 RepID=A0A7X0H5T1_9BACT|nr:DegT/DnrJ/EryC1/StrS family aminotransferase [Algisphaera agarilytica]MBB6428334.1 perosamine synthetase [Algisphaera agarilytica]
MSDIPLSQPDITDREIDAVVQTLRSGRLSIGPKLEEFEDEVARRSQRREGIGVSSGTSGLHLVLLALGIGPGDEVITTPFSFVASANCILMVGATPVFVDICPKSLNMDPAKVEAAVTDKTKAIIAVEVFGNTTHMAALEGLARKHEVALIEDCCEALGGTASCGRAAGSFGRAGVFGFYPNKQITTGEGGMIVTDDDHLAERCRSLRNQGRATGAHVGTDKNAGSWLAHERLGYNYRLSEINAALGLVQMQRLDEMLEARRTVAGLYMRRLMDWDDLVLPTIEPGAEATMSWFVFVLRLTANYGHTERDRIIQGMKRHEIGASNYFPCIHLQPFYRQQFGFQKGDFPIAESISERTIALPFFNSLDATQVELVCHTLKVMIQREQLLKRD